MKDGRRGDLAWFEVEDERVGGVGGAFFVGLYLYAYAYAYVLCYVMLGLACDCDAMSEISRDDREKREKKKEKGERKMRMEWIERFRHPEY